MTFSYDPTTDVGRVRRTIPDKEEDEAFWTDEEIQSFIIDEGNWLRATATALETMATDAIYINQHTRIGDLEVDTSRSAKLLMDRAALLRTQAEAIEDEDGFDIIEFAVDEFSYRERIRKQILRERV